MLAFWGVKRGLLRSDKSAGLFPADTGGLAKPKLTALPASVGERLLGSLTIEVVVLVLVLLLKGQVEDGDEEEEEGDEACRLIWSRVNARMLRWPAERLGSLL